MLRGELIAEINGVQNADELALWAHRRFATKNTLMTDCKFAGNSDPLRGIIASNSDPF